MEKYEIFNSQSNVMPNTFDKHIEFIDYNYDIDESTITDIDGKKEEKVYKYKTFRCNGIPEEAEVIRFFIHTKYTLDDEIACINNGDEQYKADRIELKNKAKTIYEKMSSMLK